jgi:hypothetical protein
MTTVLGGIASQPAFVCQYGRPKLGKTSDDLFSFPRAVWIAAPGALKPSLGLVGYEPTKQFYVEHIREATAIVEQIPKGKFDAVVVDDFSLLVERTVAALERGGVKGFELWGQVYKQALRLREVARVCGIHVILNAHEVCPNTDEHGHFWLGTMALPGKKLPYSIPAACDLVVRAEPNEEVKFGWPVSYRCDPSGTDWITGDRHNVTPKLSPMNLGEILRLVGRVGGNPAFGPRRLDGLEWQEVLVEKGAAALAGKLDDGDEVKKILGMIMEKALRSHTKDERHAIWAVRDTYDRAVLTDGLSAHRRKFYQF